jgi:hypothetical protein
VLDQSSIGLGRYFFFERFLQILLFADAVLIPAGQRGRQPLADEAHCAQ